LSEDELNLQQAQQVVNEYGHVLAQLSNGALAHPRSCLPRSIDTIKNAIHLILWEVHGEDKAISESLVQSYVFLCQFIDDEEAAIVNQSQHMLQSSDFAPEAMEDAYRAQGIVNRIKLEMEALMADVVAFID